MGIKSYREMAPIELIEQITEMNDAVEEEYDRVAELVEEADSRLEVFQQLLDEAIVEGDEDQIQSARIHLAEAQQEVSEADEKYDVDNEGSALDIVTDGRDCGRTRSSRIIRRRICRYR